jgi:catechol 2,3-dioxygenase-like lactoylglutathione lyase family enzyme
MIKLMPIVYVTDMARSLDFYEGLGFQSTVQDRSLTWVELHVGDSILALHATPQLPDHTIAHVELAMVWEEALETLAEKLQTAGISLERQITDEAFGRSLAVRDPDGLVIQINEHDRSLYA